MESRTGRDKQRYNSKNERQVAGVVPLNADKTKVLMIRSKKRKGWVLPKGGWETDETETEAATREAWEEAGIVIAIEYDLGEIPEMRAPKKGASVVCMYRFYEATVSKEYKDWPEADKRERRWMSYNEAREALKDRPELREALERSTIRR
ncbi:unnamed protein product [Discula destructiva]